MSNTGHTQDNAINNKPLLFGPNIWLKSTSRSWVFYWLVVLL